MTVTEYIRDHILRIAHKVDTSSYHYLRANERSFLFRKLKNNRLVIGALRYGRIGEEGKPKYDRISDIRRRLSLYERDGNLEHLVDISNLCELEFEESSHPLKHFSAQDDSEHTRRHE